MFTETIQHWYVASSEQHPIAIALRRQDDIDDARVSKREGTARRSVVQVRRAKTGPIVRRGEPYVLDASRR